MKITTMPVGMIGTNCYIIQTNKKNCVVVDPGAQGGKIITEITEHSLNVQYILLTHGHYDHIGGVNPLLKQFPDAKVYIGGGDTEMLEDTNKSYASKHKETEKDFIIEGSNIAHKKTVLNVDELEFTVLETPGHTKGGVCYICKDVIFSGDTLFRDDVGRTDLYGGNYDALKKSLKKLAELSGNYTVYPGHGEATTLEYERTNNQYIAEAVK